MNEHRTTIPAPQYPADEQTKALLALLGTLINRGDQPNTAIDPYDLSTWRGQALAARNMLATMASRLAGVAALLEMMHGDDSTTVDLMQMASSATAMNRALKACEPRLQPVMVAA